MKKDRYKCPFCGLKASDKLVDDRLVASHDEPHCSKFKELSSREFVRQASLKILADVKSMLNKHGEGDN